MTASCLDIVTLRIWDSIMDVVLMNIYMSFDISEVEHDGLAQ